MNKKRVKRHLALFMALVITMSTGMSSGSVFASSTVSTTTENSAESTTEATKEDLVLYDAAKRTDLLATEVATVDDIIVALGYGYDIENDFDGINYNKSKVNVSYYADKSSFDGNLAGDYKTYYKVEPVSGKKAYLLCRTISVREPETAVAESKDDSGTVESDDGESAPSVNSAAEAEEALLKTYTLSEGEIAGFDVGESMTISMASLSVLSAASPATGTKDGPDSMKVSNNGHVRYCGHSIGLKYVSESGDYYKRLVYCMDLNKNTTTGTVDATTKASKIKPQITYCLVNGARTLGGTCHNSKYSSGSSNQDYFITSAAIHVVNGEVKLSYYNNGSSTYNKISSLVSDAKNCDESKYDYSTGTTISITYTISPAKTEWKEVEDGLYRSVDKFVRKKSGTIKDVKYSISGAPSGLTTGEVKTDSSEIEDANDLKKYDICVAQTDASSASSNFYLYCNQAAMNKIVANKSTIKIKANAYSDEYGGRKWTPSIISQQKITFLEEFTPVTASASVKVTSNFKEGSFSLSKTDKFKNTAVPGARYYLYEDAACTELLCKLTKTDGNGNGLSGKQVLTQDTYYLKEVLEADGYERDNTVYPIGLEYFTLYDSSGKVTQQGKTMSVVEIPSPVGVMIYKKDAESGNFVKGAGFAVYKDAACKVRVLSGGDSGDVVPVFYYNEELECAVSSKFAKQQDTYYVKEEVVPDGYRDDGTVWSVQPDNGGFSETSATNTPIRCDVSATKITKETLLGDAKLSGATYGLYAASNINYPDGRGVVTYTETDNITSTKGTDFNSTGTQATEGALLATVKTDEAYEFAFGNLYYGNYYIQEIAPSEGCLLDTTKYPVNFTEASEKHQNISVTTTVIEDVMKQPFEIIKVSTDGDNDETDKVAGAEFTVKLQSEIAQVGWNSATTYDVLTTNEEGYALSKELPYGTYLVKETKTPDELYKTDDFEVVINQDSRKPQPWRILNDAPFKAYIRLVKKDSESGKTVLLAGTSFKIKNMDTEEYVTQKVGNSKVDVFTTDETGMAMTPMKIKYGNYSVEEITAPNGYVISKDSIPLKITKVGAIQIEEDEDGDPIIEVVVENKPVKGKITIHKTGEVLTGAKYSTIIDRILSVLSDNNRRVDFTYEEQSLEGAKFQIIAAEDIYTPDHQLADAIASGDAEETQNKASTKTSGDAKLKRELAIINGVPASKGAVVATLTTDASGEASLENLPLGNYQVVEVTPPQGFAICEEPVNVELAYEDQETEVVYGKADFVNARVKTELSLIKTDGVTSNPVAGATYGVYTKEDIVSVTGDVLIAADSLVDSAVTDGEGKIKFASDLPLGKYYVKEIESPEGYILDENVYDVDFTYQDPTVAVLKKELEVKETPITVEISKLDITTGKELKGATLEILNDDGETYASWVTDGTPYKLNAIPVGNYTLKETASPYGYLIANEVEFTVEETGDIQKVEMSDERVKGKIEIFKVSSKTKEPINGVEFELQDKAGKKLATLTTDKAGYAETELLDIGTYDEDGNFGEDIPYYIVETKAADGYILDDTKHEIKLQYDDSATETVVYTLKLKNKPSKPKLPQTGGNYHPWLFVGVGGALIGVGIYFYRRRRKFKA